MSQRNQQALDPALTAQRLTASEDLVSIEAIEWMLVCMAHNADFCRNAQDLIKPYNFHPQEAPLRILYEAIVACHQQYRGVAFEALHQTAVTLAQTATEVALTQEQFEKLFDWDHGVIREICSRDPASTRLTANIEYARHTLTRLARERTIIAPLRHALNPRLHQGIPANFDTMLDSINRQAAKVQATGVLPDVLAAPAVGTALEEASSYVPTGVAFIDANINGQRRGDSNGILGPTGGGKTTLAVHMAVAGAQQSWVEFQQHGHPSGRPELVVFATVEEPAKKLLPRVWSAAFQIPREKLERGTVWDTLTQPGQLDYYERQMQSHQRIQLSETERYTMHRDQLNQCFRMLDLSGSDQHPNAGSGYVPELAGYLQRYVDDGFSIRSVFIDYAGLMVERYMQAQNMDRQYFRHLLKGYGDDVRRMIAERFNCTAWSLHQLRGAANEYHPTKLVSHTDAGESKDFAVNMAVCMGLGVGCRETGCRRLNLSKVRYRPAELINPPTLRIDSRFAMMNDVTLQYTIDAVSRQFISNTDRSQVRGLTADLQPASMPGDGGSDLAQENSFI